MAFTRTNVWANGGTFDDPTILWYARGVKAMQARSLDNVTSWGFFGAMHGFDADLWQQFGFPNAPVASQANQDTFWQQCQHQSWYFLPWHRGYLWALEAMVRDCVVKLGGPADWALPYWNYFGPNNQNQLPPAFASQSWPDGQTDNPLFVTARFGPDDGGNVYVPLDQVNMNALGDGQFIGPENGANAGFGGVVTGFNHGGGPSGGIESQPHNMVHVLVGGTPNPGAMSIPDSAGMDPIFYLHHANIDRLWQVWRLNPPSHVDPMDQDDWTKGPANSGGRPFAMPKPDGSTWIYTPNDVESLDTLGYTYDDLSSPSGAPVSQLRQQRLGINLAARPSGAPAMATPRPPELTGASSNNIGLTGTETQVSVAFDPAAHANLAASFATAPARSTLPDRVFLNLENIRSQNDGIVLSVYINVPDGDDAAKHPECLAGSVGLFGASKASRVDGPHAGSGLHEVIEITDKIDALHLAGKLDGQPLKVRLVARHPIPAKDRVSVGRISVYRHAHHPG